MTDQFIEFELDFILQQRSHIDQLQREQFEKKSKKQILENENIAKDKTIRQNENLIILELKFCKRTEKVNKIKEKKQNYDDLIQEMLDMRIVDGIIKIKKYQILITKLNKLMKEERKKQKRQRKSMIKESKKS